MLEWFVPKSCVDKAMDDGLPLDDGDEIDCRPAILPSTCVDENINIFRIRKYFTYVSWSKVLKAIESKKNKKKHEILLPSL